MVVCFPTPLVPEYFDPVDPNFVGKTDLFIINDLCPIAVDPTYPECILPLRYRNPNLIKENLSNFRIHPNPSNDFIIIEDIPFEMSITICNIMGEIVIRKMNSSPILKIDISNLPSGIYIVQFENSIAQRFVKL